MRRSEFEVTDLQTIESVLSTKGYSIFNIKRRLKRIYQNLGCPLRKISEIIDNTVEHPLPPEAYDPPISKIFARSQRPPLGMHIKT
jgi:hypothetical protein